MDLKNFVVNVVSELNWALNELKDWKSTGYTYTYWTWDTNNIEFDINVQVEESTGTWASAKLKVFWIWMWAEWHSSDKVNNSHRIKFSLTEHWMQNWDRAFWKWTTPIFNKRDWQKKWS